MQSHIMGIHAQLAYAERQRYPIRIHLKDGSDCVVYVIEVELRSAMIVVLGEEKNLVVAMPVGNIESVEEPPLSLNPALISPKRRSGSFHSGL